MDEEELVFKRFPPEKQDQVRGLVNYATLMGLTGKDLVSIGGKLDRIKASNEKRAREAVLVEMLARCTLIGKDKKDSWEQRNPRRFIYTDSSGRKWRVENLSYYGTKITSDTGTVVSVQFNQRYNVSRGRNDMKQLLLNIYDGHIQLNF
jgi:hypothetical protein